MTLLRKVNTLLRATVHDSVEQLTDANCIPIYRQEIRDAEALLCRRRDALAAMIANRKDLEQEMERTERAIGRREAQLALLDPAALTDDLLHGTAAEIASMEEHLDAIRQRHTHTCQGIGREELELRKLLSELREHRRDLKFLAARQAGDRAAPRAPQETISGRLIALRETRAAITGHSESLDALEDGVAEADRRLHASPLDQALRDTGRDETSVRVQGVLARLRAKTSQAQGSGDADLQE
ncbi:MAG: PspA/IM30 family protein [Halioglobus sp.]|nr:PspA/IM30 family protein [Halioglobus sp.]